MAIVLNDQFGLGGFQFIDLSLSFLHSPDIHFASLQSLYSMSGANVPVSGNLGQATTAAVEAVAKATLPTLKNDPVAKAVYNNILGNIPKKEKVTVFCNVCSLEFSSKTVMDTHMAGYKHQKKLKSKELMASLERTESGFEKDPVSGVIRCNVCDITVNSPQLLATHVAGNKHKLRKKKREGEQTAGPVPFKKQCAGLGITGTANGVGGMNAPDVMPAKKRGRGRGAGMGGLLRQPQQEQQPSMLPQTAPQNTGPVAILSEEKSDRAPLNFKVPNCVIKLEDTKNGGKFLCNPCQAHCNSDIQLFQHINSRKHSDKLSGKVTQPHVPGGGRGGGRGWRGGTAGAGAGTVPRGGGVAGAASATSTFRGTPRGARGAGRGAGAPRGRGRGTAPPRSNNYTAPANNYNITSSFASSMPTSLSSNFVSLGSSYASEPQAYEDPYAMSAAPISTRQPSEYGLSSLLRGPSDVGMSRASTYGRAPSRGAVAGVSSGHLPGVGRATSNAYSGITEYPPSRPLSDYASYRGGGAPTAAPPAVADYSTYAAPTYDIATTNYHHGQSEAGHYPGRGMSYTYTQPLSQNFVSGGSMM